MIQQLKFTRNNKNSTSGNRLYQTRKESDAMKSEVSRHVVSLNWFTNWYLIAGCVDNEFCSNPKVFKVSDCDDHRDEKRYRYFKNGQPEQIFTPQEFCPDSCGVCNSTTTTTAPTTAPATAPTKRATAMPTVIIGMVCPYNKHKKLDMTWNVYTECIAG